MTGLDVPISSCVFEEWKLEPCVTLLRFFGSKERVLLTAHFDLKFVQAIKVSVGISIL